MTTTRSPSPPGRIWIAALASLIPWAAFLLAVSVAERSTVSVNGLVAAAPVYLGFVALPSFLALAAAKAGLMRAVVLVVMTAVTAFAGVQVATIDDGQAGLAVLLIPEVALPLALVIWVGRAVAARRPHAGSPTGAEPQGPERPVRAGNSGPARVSDRLAALVIDVAIVGSALLVPLSSMSHAKHEIAAGIVGVTVSTAYFAGLVAWRGQTIGQWVLGLAVVDTRTLGRVGLSRALARSFIVVVETAGAPMLTFCPPAIAELVSAARTGRSLTDRLLRTSVVTTR